MKVQRLGRGWEDAMRSLLLQAPDVNLFLLGFLDYQPIHRTHWYGVVDGSDVRALVLLVPGRLVVPWAPDPADAAALGEVLALRFAPCMLVGPREASDALWKVWVTSETRVERFYDQRLYTLKQRPSAEEVPGFRRARLAEWKQIAVQAGQMEEEDLGRNPHRNHPALHERVVRDRIQSGRTWVIEREGKVLFQINVGTATELGCQIGGTYVPAGARGQGLGTLGVRALCRELLLTHPSVTLHVNEANLPAVRIYEKVGFERADAFRLITVQ